MTTPGPVISVIIGTHNQLGPLKFTLLALRDQKPAVPFEIIVVDGGSTDDTVQFLTGQAQTGAIRAILNPTAQSRTAARNQGAHAAAGKFFMFLDPGMIVGPRWWMALSRTLEMDPRVAATAGKVILPDGRIDHAGLGLLEWWDSPTAGAQPRAYGTNLTARSLLAGRPAEFPASNQPMRVQALSGEGLMVRATAFFSVGGFSTRLGHDHHAVKPDFAGELAGVDLCLRLGSRGWDCVYRFESVMTRLRTASAAHPAPAGEAALVKEQEIFNRTWLGRVRGDFRVRSGQGTEPAEQTRIRRYIEPLLNFAVPGEGDQAGPRGNFSRGMASVVLVARTDLAQLRPCLDALLAHTDTIHEIICVDCGDNAIKAFLQETAGRRANFRVVAGEANLGYAAAHNRGLAAARGQHIVLVGGEVIVTPGWLETLTATADMHPQAGLIGPVTNRAGGLQLLTHTDYDSDSLRGLNSFAALVAENNAGRVDRTARLSGACLLVKRELLARIGGLDERFELGNYEDNDYCLRAGLAGYECLIAADCFVHRGGAADLTEEQIAHLLRNQEQWEIFKAKWGIPQGQALGAPLDLATLLAGGFQPGRHFHPLPRVTEQQPAPAVKITQAALA